jgi:hypothetical protein
MSDRVVWVILVVIGLALLSASALSVLMTSGPVAQLGGSGMSEVPRDGVIVEEVRLLQGNQLDRDNYNKIEVSLRTSSSIYNGPYTVCIETNRGNFCETTYVTTTGTTVTFNVGGGGQEATVEVRVHAAAG